MYKDLTRLFLQGDKGTGPVCHWSRGAKDWSNGRATGDSPWLNGIQWWLDLTAEPCLGKDSKIQQKVLIGRVRRWSLKKGEGYHGYFRGWL